MTTNGAEIERHVLSWVGITTQEHRFGGTEYRLGKREIGHYHDNLVLVDVPFPTKVRNEVVAASLVKPHRIFPNAGWVSRWLRKLGDVERAIRLLECSFGLARAARAS